MSGIRVELISDRSLLEEVWRLRYEWLCVESMFRSPQDCPAGIETDEFDGHCHTFAYFVDDSLVGTNRLVFDSHRGFPLEEHANWPSGLCRHTTWEMSRFLVDKRFRGNPTLLCMALGSNYRFSREHGITDWCATLETELLVGLSRLGFRIDLLGNPFYLSHGHWALEALSIPLLPARIALAETATYLSSKRPTLYRRILGEEPIPLAQDDGLLESLEERMSSTNHQLSLLQGNRCDRRRPDFESVDSVTLTERPSNGPVGRQEWMAAEAEYSRDRLVMLGHQIMMDWETGYMRMLAEIACSVGGDVLEVGYGMGILAKAIRELGQDAVRTHTIIDFHPQVVDRAARDIEDSEFANKTSIIHSFWEDAVQSMPDASFDAIVFDTYPLEEAEYHRNHFPFFPVARRLLRRGGVFTYYSDEDTSLSTEHLTALRHAGFTRIEYRVCDVSPPPDCMYWSARTILAPIVSP